MISSEIEIEERVADLSERIKSMRTEALRRFSLINGESSIHQMHAYIGSHNNSFVDSVRMQFLSPDDFIARWVDGLRREIIENIEAIRRRRRFGDRKKTVELLPEMWQDQFLKEYIYFFLERNFYRNFKERMRAKPEEKLWQLWFGANPLVWGLFISPALRLGKWTNDKSQMRREPYHYWTIGHVLVSGLVLPDRDRPKQFRDAEDFLEFYETVLARTSSSSYEKFFSAKYLELARGATDPEDVPLLIPELRYAGREKNHLYRLDFCVLNPYSMKKVGFEVSPASSHISIQGIRSGKTQKQMNKELGEKWAKEADKRNRYFKDYGVSVVTFADPELEYPAQCFDAIRSVLEEKPEDQISLRSAEQSLLETLGVVDI